MLAWKKASHLSACKLADESQRESRFQVERTEQSSRNQNTVHPLVLLLCSWWRNVKGDGGVCAAQRSYGITDGWRHRERCSDQPDLLLGEQNRIRWHKGQRAALSFINAEQLASWQSAVPSTEDTARLHGASASSRRGGAASGDRIKILFPPQTLCARCLFTLRDDLKNYSLVWKLKAKHR